MFTTSSDESVFVRRMGAKKVPVVKGMRSRRKEHVNKVGDVHSINTKFDQIVGESQISPKVNLIKSHATRSCLSE